MKKLVILMGLMYIFNSAAAQTDKNNTPKEKGYYNLTSLSAIIGSSNDLFGTSTIVPSLTMVNGYWFNKHFAAGIGVGAEIYEYSVFPVFADLRYKFPMRSYSPYFALKGGYGFANSSKNIIGSDSYYYSDNSTFKNKGGMMLNPEVGVYLPLGRNVKMVISLGYRYQELETEIKTKIYNGWYDDQIHPAYSHAPEYRTESITTTLNRLSFSIGFEFR